MKRSRFLASLGAIATLPFLSFKKEDKPVESVKDIQTYNGVQPLIFRQSYRVSAEEVELLKHVETSPFELSHVEHLMMKQLAHHLIKSPAMKRATILNVDGSMEYHFLLKVVQ